MDLLFEGKNYWPSDKEKLSAYKQYRHLIREKNISSIEKISEELQKPYDTVIYEIQNMIDDSYILDIHIDDKSKTIALGMGPRIYANYLLQYNHAKECEFWIPDLVKWESPQQKSFDFEKYKTLIEVERILSISEIAKIVNKSECDVMLEIQLMLDEAYISNIHINAVSKTIIPTYGPRVDFKAVYNLIDLDTPKVKYGFFDALCDYVTYSSKDDRININDLSDNDMLLVFNQYRYFIKEKNLTFISDIAKYCNDESVAFPIIQAMIDKCYLAYYHIDVIENCIVPTSGPRIDTRQYSKLIGGIPDYVIFDSEEEKLNTFKVYRDLIRNKNITSINEIAKRVTKPIDTVILEIQKMIDSQYVLDIHIDENTNTLVLSRGPKIDVYATIKKLLLSDAGFQNGIKCPNCGAANEFGEKTCEYCGTKLF